MDAGGTLLAIEAIKALKARYFRLFDTKAFDAWGEVFTQDATLQFDTAVSTQGRDGKPVPAFTGRAAIVAMVKERNATSQTVHHGHMPEIELLGPDAARGVWAMEDIVDHGSYVIHGHGHYHETYRREDGVWRIATVRLTRLRLSHVVRDGMMGF
ncbi:MAG: nuclear transport factor 2 family protein [Sphingomonadales bacterium]|nr:nuclear transport factor 2 family protein [Sphingomonadales bacterium]